MKSRKTALAVALIGALCSGSYVLGQNEGMTPGQQAFLDVFRPVDLGYNSVDYDALTSAYMKAPDDKSVSYWIVRNSQISRGSIKATNDLLSLQAAQNQKAIEQNDKIIEQNAQILTALKAQKKP